MRSLLSIVALTSFAIAVGSACSKSGGGDANVCESGSPQVCFGAAANTCYCTPVSTCAYCSALFNARPADPDPRCDAYRGQGDACHATADCQSAAGAGVPTKLVCHTASDAYASQCVVDCTGDIDCPAGEVCITDATPTGGICGRACTATTVYVDSGPDAPLPTGDSGLDASALATFENDCEAYYADQATTRTCSTCAASQIPGCTDDASPCPGDLGGCETRCNSSSISAKCACIAGCMASCTPSFGAYYACVTGGCSGPDTCP